MADSVIDIDFLLLADWAEVLGGKLYLQGGCWDQLIVGTSFPHTRNIGISVGLRVPWNATNQRWTATIRVVNEDTQETPISVQGEGETGRPAGLPAGADQFVTIAVNGVLTLAGPGSFMVIASVDGDEKRRKGFRVREASPAVRR